MIYALDGICKSRKYSLTVNLSKSLSKWCRKQNTTRAEWEREKKEHGNNNKQQNQSLNVGGSVSDDCKAERHLIKMKSCADRIRTWIIICRQSEVYVSIVRGTANCGLHPLHRGMFGRDVDWVVARSCAMNSNNKRYDFFFLDSILESVCCAFLPLTLTMPLVCRLLLYYEDQKRVSTLKMVGCTAISGNIESIRRFHFTETKAATKARRERSASIVEIGNYYKLNWNDISCLCNLSLQPFSDFVEFGGDAKSHKIVAVPTYFWTW